MKKYRVAFDSNITYSTDDYFDALELYFEALCDHDSNDETYVTLWEQTTYVDI